MVTQHILNKVKDRDPIAYGREKAISIGSEEKVSLAIDRPQEIGELRRCQQVPRVAWDHCPHLEIGLHRVYAQRQALFEPPMVLYQKMR